MTETVEIYFDDLIPEAQSNLLEKFQTTPRDENWDDVPLSDQKAEFTITEGEIKDTTSYIKGSVADMKFLLLDVENNVPKDEKFFKTN